MSKHTSRVAPLRSLRGGASRFSRKVLRPFHLAVGLGALAALGPFGCERNPPRTPDEPPTHPDEAGTDPGLRGGLRVALPPGWTANAITDAVLNLGPKGRAVMSVERTSLKALPDPQELAARFGKALAGAKPQTLDVRSGPDSTIWIFQVEGAGGNRWMGALGAHRVSGTIFLCATAPGASDAEIKAAARSCETLGG